MLGRPPNVPRRERKPAHIDLDDIQGNVLRGYTLPAAAYLFLRIVDVEPARRLMTRMLPHVMTAETWSERPGSAMNVAFTYAGLERLGLPAAILDSFPPVFREGMAARAEHLGDRGPSAPAHWEAGLGTGEAHVLVTVYAADDEQLRAAVADVIEEDAEQQAVSLVHLQRAEALPGGRDHFGFFDGIAQPAVAGRGRVGAPGRRPARRRGRLARAGHRRGRARLRRRGRHAPRRAAGALRPQRHVRRLPQAAHGPRRVPALHPRRRLSGRPGRARGQDRRPLARRHAAVGLARAGLTPAIAGDPLRINDFGYADDPRGLRCPHGAHVRRANPRDSIGFFDGRLSNRHRIVRRGRAYGPTLPPAC